MRPSRSVIVCGMPRSGSTLLKLMAGKEGLELLSVSRSWQRLIMLVTVYLATRLKAIRLLAGYIWKLTWTI